MVWARQHHGELQWNDESSLRVVLFGCPTVALRV